MKPDVPEEKYRTKKSRQVIQIQAAARQNIDGANRVESVDVLLFALCDDGTMWTRKSTSEDWYEVSNVPQP